MQEQENLEFSVKYPMTSEDLTRLNSEKYTTKKN